MTNVVCYPSYLKNEFFSRNVGKFTVIYIWMGHKTNLKPFKRLKFITKNRASNTRFWKRHRH